jgi:hypothetical protein
MRKNVGRKRRNQEMRLLFVILATSLFATGCGEVTYPRETLREAIIKLCAEEYAADVDVSITGNTLAIYLPLLNLFGPTLGLSEKAQDKVQDVLLGASRAALSTDADIKFYCVIAQDIRLPEIQLVIIKYVDDIKRAFYHDISRGEYFKRTIIDMSENPQAKKEKAIMEVFGKMELDAELQEKVLEDFFRSEPSSLAGIGYWNGKFYMKDVTLEEFLAEQIASRIRLKFRDVEPLNKYVLKMITGKFAAKGHVRFFRINFNAEPLLFVFDAEKKMPLEKDIFSNVFEEVSDVIYGYKFNGFDAVNIIEENTKRELVIPREDIYSFKRGKLGMETILAPLY